VVHVKTGPRKVAPDDFGSTDEGRAPHSEMRIRVYGWPHEIPQNREVPDIKQHSLSVPGEILYSSILCGRVL
jgi:hypothetical protein